MSSDLSPCPHRKTTATSASVGTPAAPLVCLVLAFAVAGPTIGATLTVCPEACDHATIQGAVNAAALSGDVIQLQTFLPITESDIFVGGTKSVTIRGLGYETSIVQAASVAEQDAGRVFFVDGLATLVLEDVALRHGDVDHLSGPDAYGGAIHNFGRLTLHRVHIEYSFAERGGCIYNSGELTIEDGFVSYCEASDGGGIYNAPGGVADLQEVDMLGDRASGRGGAIANFGDLHVAFGAVYGTELSPANRGGELAGCVSFNAGNLTMRNFQIVSNCNQDLGGTPSDAALALVSGSALLERVPIAFNGRPGVATALAVGSQSTLHLLDSQVRANEIDGSAIETSGTTRIEGSTVAGHLNARGVHQAGGTLEIVRSTISDNRTNDSGGGVLVEGFLARVASSTIARNHADADGDSSGDGGGVWVDPSAILEVRNSLIARNLDASPFILDVRANDCHGTMQSFGYNLIETLGPSNNPVPCALAGITAGNVIGTSPQIGELAGNGGPTQTVALLEGSPAIDGGAPFGCLDGDGQTTLGADQRGAPHVGALGTNGPICDIGSFEYGSFVGLFGDGFESGDTGGWTAAVGTP